MELPTYTSIWRIEKRLYKLYDFRLPMPLPVGQIVVFTAITVPYVLLLTLFGLPITHTLFWLYVLPPGVLTWLATRPVLESKRLPELILSHVRYLTEPSTWCRMAPVAEQDEIVVVVRVWRRVGVSRARARSAVPDVAAADVAVAGVAVAGVTAGGASAPAAGSAPARGGASRPESRVAAQSANRGLARARPSAVRGGEPLAGTPRSPAAAPPPTRAGTGVSRAVGPVSGSRPARATAPLPGDQTAQPVATGSAVPAAESVASASGVPAAESVASGSAVPAAESVASGSAVPAAESVASASGVPAAESVASGSAVPAAESVAPASGVPAPAAPAARSAPLASAPPAARSVPLVESGASAAEVGDRATPADGTGAPEATPGASAPSSAPADDTRDDRGDGQQSEGTPPVVVVPARRASARPTPLRSARAVERALSGPAAERSVSWRDRVMVVPGGRGPGRPDFEHRDSARAVLPVDGPRLVMVLGCTVGAGQTVTTLMLADVLANLRAQPVAAVDLNPGPASLTQQARTPAITSSALLAAGLPAQAGQRARSRGRLDVILDDASAHNAALPDGGRLDTMFHLLAARYQFTLADPGAVAVSQVLQVADQLVLVAPASPDAARALAMTREWLGANGHEALAAGSVTVINGVSKRSLPHAQQAELVARGRCRAIVRIPWDDHLAEPEGERAIRDSRVAAGASSRAGQLRPPVRQAYTALAGVLVAALAAGPQRRKVAR